MEDQEEDVDGSDKEVCDRTCEGGRVAAVLVKPSLVKEDSTPNSV